MNVDWLKLIVVTVQNTHIITIVTIIHQTITQYTITVLILMMIIYKLMTLDQFSDVNLRIALSRSFTYIRIMMLQSHMYSICTYNVRITTKGYAYVSVRQLRFPLL